MNSRILGPDSSLDTSSLAFLWLGLECKCSNGWGIYFGGGGWFLVLVGSPPSLQHEDPYWSIVLSLKGVFLSLRFLKTDSPPLDLKYHLAVIGYCRRWIELWIPSPALPAHANSSPCPLWSEWKAVGLDTWMAQGCSMVTVWMLLPCGTYRICKIVYLSFTGGW